MTPFDIIDAMFDEKKWSEISNIDKSKNYFIINRMMSKGFPVWASHLNDLRINPAAVVDFWKWFLSKNYKKKPVWIYAKGKAAADTKKKQSKSWYPSTAIISEYLRLNQCSMREFEAALARFPESTMEELQDLKERMGE